MINNQTPTKAPKSKASSHSNNATCTPSKKRPRSNPHPHPNVHAAAHQLQATPSPSPSPPHDRRPSKTLRVNIYGARVASSRGVHPPSPLHSTPSTPSAHGTAADTAPGGGAHATPFTTLKRLAEETLTSTPRTHLSEEDMIFMSAFERLERERGGASSTSASPKKNLKKKAQTQSRARGRRERERERQAGIAAKRQRQDRDAQDILQREREVLKFAESRAFAFAGGGACLPTPVRTPSSSSEYARERGKEWEEMILEEGEEMREEEETEVEVEVEVDGMVFEEEENSREEEEARQAWMTELESHKLAFEADCARKLKETEDFLFTRFAQLQAAYEADNVQYIAQLDAVKQTYTVEKQKAAEELEAMRSAIVVAIANANAAAQNEEVTRLRAELEQARVGAEDMERRANEAIEAELGRMQEAERLRRKEANERATEEMMRFKAQALEEVRREQEEGERKRAELERLAQQLAADNEMLMNERRQFFAQQERPMRDASMHSILSDASMHTATPHSPSPPPEQEDPTTHIQFFAQRASLLSNFKHATHHPSFTLSFNCVPWPVLKYQRDITSPAHISRAEIDQFFTHPERPIALGYHPDMLRQWKADRRAWHSDKVVPVLRRWLQERRRNLGECQDSGRADAVIKEIEDAMGVVFCYLDDKVKALQAEPRAGA